MGAGRSKGELSLGKKNPFVAFQSGEAELRAATTKARLAGG